MFSAQSGILASQSIERRQIRRWLANALGCRREFSPRTKILFALVIFTASFSVKSLHATDIAPVLHTEHQLYTGMAGQYLGSSVSMLKGNGILYPDDQSPEDTTLLARPPGYPMFLGAVYYFFGGSYYTVQLVQNLLNSISPVLIFLIAGALVSQRVGLVSAMITAMSHHCSYYSNVILPDSLCVLPIILAVYVLVITRHRRPVLGYAIAGAMLGLSVWLRPNALFMGCFFALLLLAVSRYRFQTLRRVWLMALMPFIVVAPITIRNYRIYGEFVPVSINMGIVLWEGIADAGGERFGALPTDDLVSEQEAILYDNPAYAKDWSSPDGIKRDRERVKKSMAVIARHPVWFAGAMIGRMSDMLKYSAEAPLVFRSGDTRMIELGKEMEGQKNPNRTPKEKDIEADRSLGSIGQWFFWLRTVARALQRITKETAQVFIAIGTIIMFILSWRRSLFISMVPLYFLLIQSMTHIEFRYTLPMHYFLFIFAATVWVLIGYATWRGIKRLLHRWAFI